MSKLEGIIEGEPEDLDALCHYFKSIMSRESPSGVVKVEINLEKPAYSNTLARSKRFAPEEPIPIRIYAMINGIMNIVTRRTADIGILKLDLIDSSSKLLIKSFPYNHSKFYKRSQMYAFTHPDIDASKLLLLALKDDTLTDVLMLFSQPGESYSWSKFYVLMEIIKIVVAEREGLVIKVPEFEKFICDKLSIKAKDLGIFCNMANNDRSVMAGMRHSQRIESAKKINNIEPDLTWAFRFLQQVIINWLNKYYNFEVIEAKVDKLKLFPNHDPKFLNNIKLLEH